MDKRWTIGNVNTKNERARRIAELAAKAHKNNLQVTFKWVNSHSTCLGNILADQYARDAIIYGQTSNINLTTNMAKKLVKLAAEQRWIYKVSFAWHTYREQFPVPIDRRFSKNTQLNVHQCQFVLGNSGYLRTVRNTRDGLGTLCECGEQEQTLHHLIFYCKLMDSLTEDIASKYKTSRSSILSSNKVVYIIRKLDDGFRSILSSFRPEGLELGSVVN